MRLETPVARWGAGIGLALVLLYAAALAWALETQSYNVWGSLLIAPLIWGANAILIWRVGKKEDDPWIVSLLGIGFVLKMLASFARYWMVFVLYSGGGDSARYNAYASYQHELWRQGFFVWDAATTKVGTQILELVTTAVYTIIGPAPLAGFLVFASFAFWGSYLLYRAFRLTLPSGSYRVYAALVFLLPSILFWPSSIGKEAWLLLWVGVTALGAARFFNNRPGAWTLLILGMVGTSMIRPHLTVLLAAGLLVAQTFRPVRDEAIGVLSKVLGLMVIVGAVMILTTQSAEFLGIEDLNLDSVTETVDRASGNTTQGGSEFTPVPLTAPLGVPSAIVTMLFRPFPWEASGLPMLMQSAEGLFLMWFVWRQRSRVRQLPRLMRQNPYVTFAFIYSLAFMLAFAEFGNFGILARQRTLMIPLLLVVLALPKPRERASDPATAKAQMLSRY